MSGLKIVPILALLIGLTWLGTFFVEANRMDVVINFGHHQTPPAALGFVVLSAIVLGMFISGILCSLEILALYVQNRKLRRKLARVAPTKAPSVTSPVPDAPKEPSAALTSGQTSFNDLEHTGSFKNL
jgi:hypothetical protein